MKYEWVDRERKDTIVFLKLFAIVLGVLYVYAIYVILSQYIAGKQSFSDVLVSVGVILFILIFVLMAISSLGDSFVLPRLEERYLILPNPHWYNLFSKVVFDIYDIKEIRLHQSSTGEKESCNAIWKVILKDGRTIDFIKKNIISSHGNLELTKILIKKLEGKAKIISCLEHQESESR